MRHGHEAAPAVARLLKTVCHGVGIAQIRPLSASAALTRRRRARVRAPGGPGGRPGASSWPPVRVRCPVAFSLSATFAHEKPARAVLDDRCERFLLALVPCLAAVDELETVGRHPARGAALLLEHLQRCRRALGGCFPLPLRHCSGGGDRWRNWSCSTWRRP